MTTQTGRHPSPGPRAAASVAGVLHPDTNVAEALANPLLWQHEYDQAQAIPSTTRTTPSRGLILCDQFLNPQLGGLALDAGSGPGRNAVYLAQRGWQVWAVDFAPSPLRQLRERVIIEGAQHRITPVAASLLNTLPFREATFGLVVDSYVYCHALHDSSRTQLKCEYHRVLKPGGVLYSLVFSTTDEYYLALLDSGYGFDQIVRDPTNGIAKRLYNETEIKSDFTNLFLLKHFLKFEFNDTVRAKTYRRSVYISLLEARP